MPGTSPDQPLPATGGNPAASGSAADPSAARLYDTALAGGLGVRPGDRVELVRTNDPYTQLRPGDQGTVRHVRENLGEPEIAVAWDDGSRLSILPDSGDQIRVLH